MSCRFMSRARPHRPVHGRSPKLRKDQRVGQAAAAILHACSRHVAANIDGARRGQDPESLHQLRVGLRRLRAALPIFAALISPDLRQEWAERLRHLEHGVGAAREWDVLVAEIQRAADEDGDPGQLDRLLRKAVIRRARSHRQARRALKGAEIRRLMLQINHYADGQKRGLGGAASDTWGTPLRPFARQSLDARHRKVRKGGRGIRRLDAKALHALRIRVKKLRYVTEFFANLWPEAMSEPYLAALRRLQDDLGVIQDAASGRALLKALVPGRPTCLDSDLRRMSKWIARKRIHARRRLARRWQAFEAAEVFWTSDSPG